MPLPDAFRSHFPETTRLAEDILRDAGESVARRVAEFTLCDLVLYACVACHAAGMRAACSAAEAKRAFLEGSLSFDDLLRERRAAVNECYWGWDPSVGRASLAAAWVDGAPTSLCAFDEEEAERILNLDTLDEAAEIALELQENAVAIRAWLGRQLVLRALQHGVGGAEVGIDPDTLIGLPIDDLAPMTWLASKAPFTLEGPDGWTHADQTIRKDTLCVHLDEDHRIVRVANEED